jgi:predicted transcriptional regulator
MEPELVRRLDELAARLDRIESVLLREGDLRERLAHEERARRELADQTAWLIEFLGEARQEIRWLKEQRAKGS